MAGNGGSSEASQVLKAALQALRQGGGGKK